jgi:hypothetical protein
MRDPQFEILAVSALSPSRRITATNPKSPHSIGLLGARYHTAVTETPVCLLITSLHFSRAALWIDSIQFRVIRGC